MTLPVLRLGELKIFLHKGLTRITEPIQASVDLLKTDNHDNDPQPYLQELWWSSGKGASSWPKGSEFEFDPISVLYLMSPKGDETDSEGLDEKWVGSRSNESHSS